AGRAGRVAQAGNADPLVGARRTGEGDHPRRPQGVDDIDGLGARGRMAPAEAGEVLVEAKEPGAVARALAEKVLAVAQKIVEAIRLPSADLLAHEEHRRARGQQGQAEGDAAARLREIAG